jgi:alpha-N-acetylglucosamine transferase
MKDSGCCGASEFVKLWAFTLTQYHRVVHLDMDTVLYRNIVSASQRLPATTHYYLLSILLNYYVIPIC